MMTGHGFNISAVERDTGLSKDVLRAWERRYGFPAPHRDAHGERVYPADQVERLRLIKRLIDQGHRPGKLVAAPGETLASLKPRRTARVEDVADNRSAETLDTLLDLIGRHDGPAYQQMLSRHLARHGLPSFVQDIIAPLAHLVGEAWENGRFEVHEEHFFTELTVRLLRQIIAGLPPRPDGPRILLTTLPDEKHVLGLLMAEALFTLDGGNCIPLGTETPLSDIARAAETHQVDVVALSFSAAFPSRQIPGLLRQLRQRLPAQVRLWAGGEGMAHTPRSAEAGIETLVTLANARQALLGFLSEQPGRKIES